MHDVSRRMTETTVFDLVSAQAGRTPDACAVRAIDGKWTYAQVLDFAHSVASALHADGLQHEEPVAVFMLRTAALPSVLLGILRAGGAYLPIDLQDPPDRVMTMLRIAGCKRVIADAATLEKLRPFGDTGVRLTDVAAIAPTRNDLPPSPVPSDLAYVIFTSGSTGQPKAVEVEHRAMANVLLQARDLLQFSADDTFLAVTTLAFDISVVELFLPLIVGADVLLRDKPTLLNPKEMARLVREEGVTAIHTGPSVWSVILGQIPDFPKLRIAVSAGEAVSPAIARTISAYADTAWNMYGPTEATVWATGHIMRRDDPDNGTDISAPIGTPFQGVAVRVEDPNGALVADGEEGELLLGDVCVSRGYRNRPDLTAEKFVTRDDMRFYRTGDRVVRNAGGILQYKGRFDDQISIQGRRIEPREIEILIDAVPGIAQSAATWFLTESNTRAIVAAIVPDRGTTPDPDAIRLTLKKQVPEAMIPAKFLILDALPINKNAKVDRAAIRALLEGPSVDIASNAPIVGMTATEMVIADIWNRAMRVNTVGPASHFFAIGGDSLAAVTMNLRVENKLGISLPSQLVLETPVLRDYAARVDEIRARQFSPSNTNYIFPLVERPGTHPVFFVGADLRLAGHWHIPCSLYAVAYWAVGGKLVEMETLELLAATYIEGIKGLQPTGPYRIAGYSFGGLVALEIAQQLRRLGEQVEFLFILDPYQLSRTAIDRSQNVTRHASTRPSASSRFSNYGRESVAAIRRHGLRGLIASFYRPFQKIRGGPWLMYQLFHLHRRHPNLVRESLLPKSYWPVFWYSARRKAGEYVAHPYVDRALAIFTPKQGGEDAWLPIVGPHNTIRLDVDHLSLFEAETAYLWQLRLMDLVNAKNPS